MDSLARAVNLYLQEAPTKSVIETLLTSPSWMEESFQEQVVSKVYSKHFLELSRWLTTHWSWRMEEFTNMSDKYFDKLMEKDAVVKWVPIPL